MRIAITNPSTWPRVRRGAERFLNELAEFLAARGHEVTVIACKPGKIETRRERGFTTICHRRMYHPALARVGFLEFHAFAGTALTALLNKRYDAVHCCTFTDAFAASVARRVTNVPYVFWVNGLPPRVRYVRALTLRGAIFRRAIRYADEVISLSRYMHTDFADRFGRGGQVLPVPVDTVRFRLNTQRDLSRPIILCAAALDDQRKGGTLLMRAFDRVKATCPNAILQIACKLAPENQADLMQHVSPKWRDDVHMIGDGKLEDLPGVFGRAAVSVLPSLWEAFGMVILESMSTGTPVVGTRDGGIPELINNPRVGRLFDPGATQTPQPTNLDGLVQALLEGIELSRSEDTAHACRAHAEQYSWSIVGPHFEAIYEDVIARRRGRKTQT